MTWNYRVIRNMDARGEYFYAIHEVYYNDDEGELSWTENPIKLVGESEDEIKADLNLINQAFTRPILDMKKLQGYYLGDELQGRVQKDVLDE